MTDRLDAQLVQLLRDEPRVGVLEASRRLGVARGTVQARLDRMQARGVITGFGPDIDPAAYGRERHALLGPDVDRISDEYEFALLREARRETS